MKQTLIREYFEKNNGILSILPTFVPRRFCKAGHRLRLHPDDYFALGTHRGAIKERWFSSVICAMNGPDAAPDEGMSYVDMGDAEKISLKDFVTELNYYRFTIYTVKCHKVVKLNINTAVCLDSSFFYLRCI